MRNENEEMRNEGLRMLVIADDITGAAEIAGMAYSKGQQVRLLCADCTDSAGCTDSVGNTTITVIATDTRSMTEAEATAETRRLASFLISHSSFLLSPADSSFLIPHSSFLLFKKTDSALRGHVVAELAALMEATGFQRAVYLPANPSKGRVIRGGIYYIKGVPIHETAFSYDPEFPARTSLLSERFPHAAEKGIVMPDAVSDDDIRRIVEQYNDGRTLFAGAADLFSALLTPASAPLLEGTRECGGHCKTLLLCGSTQSKPLDIGLPIAAMPRAVYDGEQTAADWFRLVGDQWAVANGLILTIPHTHRTGKDIAVHLRTVMAEMTRLLVALCRPRHLVIEGGATAWATLQALGWTDFHIRQQFAPGVVQMENVTNGTLVTLKPGSYPWGRLFAAGQAD